MSEPLASPSSATHLSEGANALHWDGETTVWPEIGLALSGGGYRAMLFHAGALLRLNELGILPRVRRIASVSGGSIAAGFLALIWSQLGKPDASGTFASFKALYVEPILKFSSNNIDVSDILLGLLPWETAADEIAKSYNKLLFHGAALGAVTDQPQFVFCANSLQTGVLWRFTRGYAGDYVVGRWDSPDIDLAHVVAASSAFPPFLSPVALTPPADQFSDWPTDQPGTSGLVDPKPFRERVLLSDGGVYDNLGLEPIQKSYMTVLASDGGAPFTPEPSVGADPIRQLMRVLDIAMNQAHALRLRDLMARFMEGTKRRQAGTLKPGDIDPYARLGSYWGIDTSPMKAPPPGALPCRPETAAKLAALSTRLANLGTTESRSLVNWGYAICDQCVRKYYDGFPSAPPPAWPYADAPLG